MRILKSLVIAGMAGLAACAESPADVEHPLLPAAFTTNSTWGTLLGTQSSVFPSTNELNAAKSPRWANVAFVDAFVGEVTLNFSQPRAFYACFEYRVDDEAPVSASNYNTLVTDGLWSYTCQSASAEELVIHARQYVDVRMAFGAETDERFDWTRFYVPTKEESLTMCKVDPGWETMGFDNLGQCIKYAETGYDARQ